MANTFTCPYPQTINNPDGVILPADTTSKKTIFTAGSNGSILRALFASSTDTSDRAIILYINVGGAGTDRQVCTVSIPLNSGNTTAIYPVDILHSAALASYLAYDANGNRVWYLKPGTTLKVACTSTVTTAKEIDFVGDALDY